MPIYTKKVGTMISIPHSGGRRATSAKEAVGISISIAPVDTVWKPSYPQSVARKINARPED